MNLRELLDHVRDNLLRDAADPPLWGDSELTRYLNEAHTLFARRTHCLSDATSDFTFLETEPGVGTYALDPRVILVLEVVDENGVVLLDRTRGQMGRHRLATGMPRFYTCDAAARSVRLYPTPDAAYTLDMQVARKPLQPMAQDTDEPETDEEFHLALCDWAAYRALRNNDPDGTNTVAAEPFRVEWELAVREAKRQVFRLQAGASPTARANWTGKR